MQYDVQWNSEEFGQDSSRPRAKRVDTGATPTTVNPGFEEDQNDDSHARGRGKRSPTKKKNSLYSAQEQSEAYSEDYKGRENKTAELGWTKVTNGKPHSDVASGPFFPRARGFGKGFSLADTPLETWETEDELEVEKILATNPYGSLTKTPKRNLSQPFSSEKDGLQNSEERLISGRKGKVLGDRNGPVYTPVAAMPVAAMTDDAEAVGGQMVQEEVTRKMTYDSQGRYQPYGIEQKYKEKKIESKWDIIEAEEANAALYDASLTMQPVSEPTSESDSFSDVSGQSASSEEVAELRSMMADMAKRMDKLLEENKKAATAAQEAKERAEEAERRVREAEMNTADALAAVPDNAPVATQPKAPASPKPKVSSDEVSLKNHEASRPNVMRIANLVKSMLGKKLELTGRETYEAWAEAIRSMAAQEEWPLKLLDLDGEKWDETTENALQAKLRKEMFAVMRDTISWSKVFSKVQKVLNGDHRQDAQALWRRLHHFFADGVQDGDVSAAGIKLRSCSMASTKANVVDYGLKLLKLEKRLVDMGVPTNVQRELIPLYLRGLARVFDPIKNQLKTEMEQDPDKEWELEEVMERVEKRATRDSLLNAYIDNGKVIFQGASTDDSRDGKGKKDKKKKKKTSKKIKQLQQKIDQLTAGASSTPATQLQATSRPRPPGKKGFCSFGDKCWRIDCSFQHKPGHKPAPNSTNATCGKCGKKGHTTAEHGMCFRCKKVGHYASSPDCPMNPNKAQQSLQVVQSMPVIYEINSEYGEDEEAHF